MRDAPDSAAAEAYRFALSSLETAFKGPVGHIAFVASSKVGQGKTTSMANLALAAASLGYQVLAIDADFGIRISPGSWTPHHFGTGGPGSPTFWMDVLIWILPCGKFPWLIRRILN